MTIATPVDALFFTALEKGSAAERADYLDSACGGDAVLRRQVERLLWAHPRLGDFLGRPAVEQLAAAVGLANTTEVLASSTGGPPSPDLAPIDGR